MAVLTFKNHTSIRIKGKPEEIDSYEYQQWHWVDLRSYTTANGETIYWIAEWSQVSGSREQRSYMPTVEAIRDYYTQKGKQMAQRYRDSIEPYIDPDAIIDVDALVRASS